MDASKISDWIMRSILTYLDFPTFQRLRLVNSKMKSLVEESPKFREKYPIKIDSEEILEEILQCDTSSNNFSLEIFEFHKLKHFNEFQKKISPQIKILKIETFKQPKAWEFIASCSNLQTLEIPLSAYEHFKISSTNTELIKVFQNVKTLSITIYGGLGGFNIPLETYEEFGNFLQYFEQLEKFHLSLPYNDNIYGFLGYQILLYLAFRSSRFKALLPNNIRLGDYIVDADKQLVNWNAYENRLLSLSPWILTNEIKLDLQGIEKDTSFGTTEDGILSRVNLIRKYYNNKNKNEIMDIKKFKRLESFCFIDEFKSWDTEFTPLFSVNPFNSKEIVKHLKCLDLRYVPISEEHFKLLGSTFGFENNQVETLRLHFKSVSGSLVEDTPTVVVANFLQNFPKLRDLCVRWWFSPHWIKVLTNLKRLEIVSASLMDETFLGVKPWDLENPWFLKLKNLTHLKLKKIYWNSNLVCKNVFSRMRLKSLHISNFGSSREGCCTTLEGIKPLAEGPFADTIQDFPHPSVFCDKCEGSTVEEFNEFRRKHFKFF